MLQHLSMMLLYCTQLYLFGQRDVIKSKLLMSVHYFHCGFIFWLFSPLICFSFLKVLETARSNKWNVTAVSAARQVRRRRSVPDGLGHVVGRVSWQRVVEVPDEVISVLFSQSHEGPAHHDELHLVHAVTELLQLQTHNTNTHEAFFTISLAVIESKVKSSKVN